jgi:uncharacterized secreted protein with C-terminal beta-propeller domain
MAPGERAPVSEKAAVPPAAAAYSGTNVNEAGVDEPDLVKTDGRRIVTVRDGVLRVVDPVTRVQTGRLDLGPDAAGEAQLLLSGDRALVLASGRAFQGGPRRIRPMGGEAEVLLVDLAGTPRVISRYHGSGTLVDARQTGSVARVVLSSAPSITFPFRANSTAGLLRENRSVVAEAPLTAWLPSWEITTGTITTEGRLGCGSISRPASFSGAALLSVLTFDLGAAALTDGDPVGIVADGDTVYGTPTSLYVANNQSWRMNAVDTGMAGPPGNTEIFRFAVSGPGRPTFAASGSVPGTLLNQYAMSEWDGYLRVATTNGVTNASAVRVLREKAGKLVQVGSVDGLGKGERIYSVRFAGARGFVVTFRQTDPLYSLDLADPAHPRVTGALKISGYSAHLQPVGDDRLIGIGQEATELGRPLGTQISLFDVADPANPKRLAQQQIPFAGSEAEFDPHALLWWPATQLLVLPIMDTNGANSALALRVTTTGLQNLSRITPPATTTGVVRRELVIGDTLWVLTDSGLLASTLSTLDSLAWVDLQ